MIKIEPTDKIEARIIKNAFNNFMNLDFHDDIKWKRKEWKRFWKEVVKESQGKLRLR